MASESIQVNYVGRKPYAEVLELQEKHFNQLLEEKKNMGYSESPMHLIFMPA